MNRILRRPMFRTGGSAEGLTSGLQPRQGYKDANLVEQLTTQKSIIDALAPRTPRKDTSMRDFLINFGLDIASRPPSGSIFSTAAASAKEPFGKFQQAKQIEEAYGMKETEEDRALITGLIKGMDDDKLSAMMKKVKDGVEAGYYKDEKEGIRRQLAKDEFGVMPMEGEQKEEWIKWYMTNLQNKADVDPGVARAVAEHQYKIDFKEYPEKALKDMNRTKMYIKEVHKKEETRGDDGQIDQILLDGNYDYYYAQNQIYLDPQTGNLYKRVSKKGQAPVLQRVILEE